MASKRPSELAEIGCDWCAYQFDQALLVREALAYRKAEREQEAAQSLENNRQLREAS